MREHGRLDAILLGGGFVCVVNKKKYMSVEIKTSNGGSEGEEGINHQHRNIERDINK